MGKTLYYIKIGHLISNGIQPLATYILFTTIIFFVAAHPSHSQKRYLFKTYTVNDGLSDNTIFGINQDSKGYLWIATDGGISRFDGNKFDNSVIPEVNQEQLFTMMIDKGPSNRLAVATFLNGVMVEQENSSFKQYLLTPKQLGKNVTKTVKWISDTKILFSESRDICMIDGDSVYQIYDCGVNKNMFQTTEYDTEGNIWFGGIDGVGIFFNGSTNAEPYILPELSGVYIIKILFYGNNHLLVGTRDGYYEIEIETATIDNFKYRVQKKFPEFDGKRINHIYIDTNDNIWISFAIEGVAQVKDGKIIRWITHETGLPTHGAMCVFQDNEHNFWFGTSDGISRLYSLSDFSFTYNDKQLPGMGYFCIDPYNRLMFSDNKLLYSIENDTVKSYPLRNTPFENERILSATFKDGYGYFFTINSVFTMKCSEELKWNKISKIADFKKNNLSDLKSYFFDDNNELLMGFLNGLYVLKNEEITKVKIESEKEIRLRPNSILKDKFGNFWLGDFTYGLHHFEKNGYDGQGTPILKHLQSYESLKPDSAFATAWIQDMIFDNEGHIWMSSLFSGVYKLTIDQSGVKTYKLYSTKDGLSSNDVKQIIQAKDNSIWFATRNGADRLIIDDDGTERIIHYNEKNGFGRMVYKILPSDSITYISYDNGFYIIDNKINKRCIGRPLEVVVSNIAIMGKADINALSYINGDKYQLDYNRNSISFDFSVTRLRDNKGLEYQYKLEGADKEWSDFSDRRYANYVSLEPGDYTFEVRAKIINHEEEQPITQFRFKIRAPFYKTWWFISLVIILPVVLVIFLYRYKIKQVIKLQRLREKIASDLHDDIGSTLSSISIMSDLLQMQLDNTTRAEQMIREIGTNAHTMLDSMDDIIWSVNPMNDKIDSLILRIKEFAIPLFEIKDINFMFIIPSDLHSLPIPMDVRRNLYLIAKESINNLVKHSNGNKALIEFSYSHPILTLKIEDNGKGFSDKDIGEGTNGIKNMQRRADQINGQIDIKSESAMGTRITLSVKII